MFNLNFEKQKSETTITDLYNKYGILTEGVSEEGGKIILSNKLIDEGWKVGLSFRDTDDHVKYVKDEIETGKSFYDFTLATLKNEPFNRTRVILFKEKEGNYN